MQVCCAVPGREWGGRTDGSAGAGAAAGVGDPLRDSRAGGGHARVRPCRLRSRAGLVGSAVAPAGLPASAQSWPR